MLALLDLFNYEDVVDQADAILGALRSGQMPCDGAWPAAQLDKLQHWIDRGKPAKVWPPAPRQRAGLAEQAEEDHRDPVTPEIRSTCRSAPPATRVYGTLSALASGR